MHCEALVQSPTPLLQIPLSFFLRGSPGLSSSAPRREQREVKHLPRRTPLAASAHTLESDARFQHCSLATFGGERVFPSSSSHPPSFLTTRRCRPPNVSAPSPDAATLLVTPGSHRNLRRSWRPSGPTPAAAAGELTARDRAPALPLDFWRPARLWGDPQGDRSCRGAVGLVSRGLRRVGAPARGPLPETGLLELSEHPALRDPENNGGAGTPRPAGLLPQLGHIPQRSNQTAKVTVTVAPHGAGTRLLL
ncbi:hypothetical protein NDU88_007786 [Pleurodeles waltl]|uniref:Uncharacterized protein n=1 Tax=Pleurodeles waltl TaxID=8319 RepID=A0AAV7U0R6_PLEWA|nr:hypothetical protein NDU88_007786 [Pleurodeles waltl]